MKYLDLLLVLTFFVSVGVRGAELSEELEYQFTDQIANMVGHSNCTLHQADQITLIACPESFEVYKTNSLALQPFALENSGESGEILDVRPSLETGRQNRLTYIQ